MLLPDPLLAHTQLTSYQTQTAPAAELPHSRPKPSPWMPPVSGQNFIFPFQISRGCCWLLLWAAQVPLNTALPSNKLTAPTLVCQLQNFHSFSSLLMASFLLDPTCFYLIYLLNTAKLQPALLFGLTSRSLSSLIQITLLTQFFLIHNIQPHGPGECKFPRCCNKAFF